MYLITLAHCTQNWKTKNQGFRKRLGKQIVTHSCCRWQQLMGPSPTWFPQSLLKACLFFLVNSSWSCHWLVTCFLFSFCPKSSLVGLPLGTNTYLPHFCYYNYRDGFCNLVIITAVFLLLFSFIEFYCFNIVAIWLLPGIMKGKGRAEILFKKK